MNKNEQGFIATGTMSVASVNEPILSHDGRVIGFQTSKGIIRLCVCLELERPDGTFEYLPKEHEMQTVGVDLLDYDKVEFLGPEVS